MVTDPVVDQTEGSLSASYQMNTQNTKQSRASQNFTPSLQQVRTDRNLSQFKFGKGARRNPLQTYTNSKLTPVIEHRALKHLTTHRVETGSSQEESEVSSQTIPIPSISEDEMGENESNIKRKINKS